MDIMIKNKDYRMNDNESSLSMDDVIKANVYGFAKKIVGELDLDDAYVDQAIVFCGLCKPCILAYLFAVYLKLEEKYKLLLQNVKKDKKIAEDESIWQELEQDKDVSACIFAQAQWYWIVEERRKLNPMLGDLIKSLNNNSPKGPSIP